MPQIVLPLEQMLGKVRATLDAREDPDLLIVARTDVAWATGDVDEAINRANAFSEVGADMVFLIGVAPPALSAGREQIEGRVMVVDTPGDTMADEERAGADVVLYYGFTLYAAYAGVKRALSGFRETGDLGRLAAPMADVAVFERFIGYDDFAAKTREYGRGQEL